MDGTPALVPILAILFVVFGLQKFMEFLGEIIKVLLWIIAVIAIGGIILSLVV